MDSLKNLDNKLLDILHQAYILVGTTNESYSPGSLLKEKLNLRLEQLEKEEKNLQENISEIITFTDNKLRDDSTIRERFVAKCLEILEALEIILRNINEIKVQTSVKGNKKEEPDCLGIRDLRIIHTMLEIVISWGIYPCLLPGVGIPISHRTRSGYILSDFLKELDDEKEVEKEKEEKSTTNNFKNIKDIKDLYLFSLMKSLTNIIFPTLNKPIFLTTTISSIILEKHITDIYAALLQLAYGPSPSISSLSSSSSSIQEKEKEKTKVNDLKKLTKIQKESNIMFCKIFEGSDSFQSLNALTMLLSSSPIHTSPNWLKNICGQYLTQILLRPNGVKDIMEFMIGDESEVNLSKLETISKLILSVPNTAKSPEAYFSIICPQLLSIVQSFTSSSLSLQNFKSSPSANVASFIIARMSIKFPNITKKFIINKIFNKLWKWWGISSEEKSKIFQNYNNNNNNYYNNDNNSLDPLIMDEQTLQFTISTIHYLLVGSEPIPNLLQFFLKDSITPLYYLYSFTCSSKSFLKDIILDILLAYFKIIAIDDSVKALKEILFRKKNERLKAPQSSDIGEIYFAPGSSGGAVMRFRMTSSNLSSPIITTKTTTITIDNIDTFINFIRSISNNELTGDFFMYVLTEYTSLKSLQSKQQLQDSISKSLFTLLNLILAMIDQLGSKILQKPGQMIAFVNNVLEEYIHKKENKRAKQNINIQTFKKGWRSELSNIVKNEEYEENEDEDEELLSLALSLLESLLSEHKTLPTKDIKVLNLVSNNLSQFQTHHPKSSIRSLSQNLILIILTTTTSNNNNGQSQNSISSQEYLCQQESQKKFQEAMNALKDNILPIKAYGIVTLKEMILSKDILMNEEANLNKVLDIFIQLVQDEESFIYFNAIKGLSSLTDIHGKKIMEKLMKIYSDSIQNLDDRLRVGEAILQTIQRCGDVLGKYITTLLPPLLQVLNKDQNKILRISALSIIGFACETSPLALTTWFRDIVDWILNILDIQKDVEIRRASIVLLISLIRGLSSHSQSIFLIPKDLLERSWRTLKYVEEIDNDDLIKYHARVGISILETISQNELMGINNVDKF
ncbi:hypothetical protein Glove_106g48 [Diversispora epigaea]|uniref:RNA polymerase II assembly factor Rtp1 C-terminal domain-containing protein n=1 Tax=Diversispora epigaea TaxID=1348612 RepID=A0A397J5D7_9GLOM|nr:hypothetical protein Glove_106g48 [Diversispora epigaea]